MQDLTLFIQHHLTLTLLFAVLVVLIFIIEMLRLKNKAGQLSSSQLTMMINHQQAQVIDLRPSEQFTKGHIIDALSLPLTEFKEKSKKLEKMKNHPLILVCAKGFDSPKIAASLQTQGFQVHILRGGIQTWLQDNLPLVKD